MVLDDGSGFSATRFLFLFCKHEKESWKPVAPEFFIFLYYLLRKKKTRDHTKVVFLSFCYVLIPLTPCKKNVSPVQHICDDVYVMVSANGKQRDKNGI